MGRYTFRHSHSIRVSVLITVISTLLSIIAVQLRIAEPLLMCLPDTTSLPSTKKESSFDYYSYIKAASNSRYVNDIVLVSVDGMNRAGIAEVIDTIAKHKPDVVGIDIYFPDRKDPDTDSLLINAIASVDNCVLSSFVESNGNDYWIQGSYFAKQAGFTEAIVNIYDKSRRIVQYRDDFADQILPTFSWEVARLYKHLDPSKTLPLNKSYVNYVNYSYSRYDVWDFEKIIENSDIAHDLFNNKIVLLGCFEDGADYHEIPTGEKVAGLFIHAYAISTIINDDYIKGISPFSTWLVSAILCFLITLLYIHIIHKGWKFTSWILKLVELIMMFLLIWVCLLLFTKGYFIDFIPYFTIFAFQLVCISFVRNIKDTI